MCPAGWWSSSGASQCSACPVGTFYPSEGAASAEQCIRCPPGTFGPLVNATSPLDCARCPAGSWSDATGASSNATCVACPARHIAASAGMSACVSCGPGEFAASSTRCGACAAGHVVSADGSRCNDTCEAGQAPSADQLSCVACAAGNTSRRGMAACEACAPGTFTSSSGLGECAACPRDTFASSSGMSSCAACPWSRETRRVGSVSLSECVCAVGMLLADPSNATSECAACPEGGMCDGVSVVPSVLPGFFAADPMSRRIERCVPAEACRGSESAGNASRCASGYEGLRCAQCASGWFRRDEQCRECPRVSVLYLLVFVAALAGVLGLSSVLLRIGASLAPLTIAVDYFQVLSKFGSMRLSWSNSTGAILESFQYVELNVQLAAPECFVRAGYATKWLAFQSVPALCVLMVAVFVVSWLATAGRGSGGEAVKRMWSRAVGVMLLVLQVVYVTLVSKVLEVFDCRQVTQTLSVLEADTTIECGGAQHGKLVAYGALFGALYGAGIPALFWWCLRLARAKIEDATRGRSDRVVAAAAAAARRRSSVSSATAAAAGDALSSSSSSSSMQAKLSRIETMFGCLYRRFRGGASFWILCLLARRVAFSFCVIMLTSRVRTQTTMLSIVFTASLAAQLVMKPYLKTAQHDGKSRSRLFVSLRDDPNAMEASSLMSSLAVLLSGSLYDAGQREDLASGPSTRAVLLDVMCALLVVMSAVYMMFAIAASMAGVIRSRRKQSVSRSIGGAAKAKASSGPAAAAAALSKQGEWRMQNPMLQSRPSGGPRATTATPGPAAGGGGGESDPQQASMRRSEKSESPGPAARGRAGQALASDRESSAGLEALVSQMQRERQEMQRERQEMQRERQELMSRLDRQEADRQRERQEWREQDRRRESELLARIERLVSSRGPQ